MFDPEPQQDVQFCDLYVRINPKNIAFLKFILEGYDGLALVTTMSSHEGLVRLLAPRSRQDELWRLLGELACNWQQFSPQPQP